MKRDVHDRIRRALFQGAVFAAGFALAGGAFAQSGKEADDSEEIIVTAQKKSQALQNVPIAVTALSGATLEQKQITGFKDLQFNAPALTFSQGNFVTNNNIQIRGVGLTSTSNSSDTGVALHIDDIYLLSASGLATGEYYDMERIEVLRGPQGTLYGRNATGGTVNLITAKPDSSEFGASGYVSYGTNNTVRASSWVNLPLVEGELALRVAGIYARNDGVVENVYTGNDVHGLDVYSLRGSLQWTPTSTTTIDIMYQYTREDDTRMRSPKQLCHRDPSGVLGCLPDRLGFDAVNGNAQITNITISSAVLGAFGPVNLGFGGLAPVPGANTFSDVPDDMFKISTETDPHFRSGDDLVKLSVRQDVNDWLTATIVVGHDKSYYDSHLNINSLVGDDLSSQLAQSLAIFQAAFGAAATPYIQAFFSGPNGTRAFPLTDSLGLGITGGEITGYSPRVRSDDRVVGTTEQTSYELRFNTEFDGPLNFMLAGYYLDAEQTSDYRAASNALDYGSIILGRLVSLQAIQAGAPLNPATPYLLGPGFHNQTPLYSLKSKSIFGEVYWDIVPDSVRLTVGLRYLEDEKREVSRQNLFATLLPVGTTDVDAAYAAANLDFDGTKPGNQLFSDQSGKFDATTGRAVLEWRPDIAWTDRTLVYASYSRGFKSGGFNPPQRQTVQFPIAFEPEKIDAFEIGTKNRLLDGRLNVNLSAYYYDYKGLQISKTVNLSAVNENIDATIWGLEGEFSYEPIDNLRFSLNVATTQSKIADGVRSVNLRNPGAGVANAVVVKGVQTGSLGALCVILMDPSVGNLTPAEAGVTGFFVPAGGVTQIATYGVPYVNYGRCSGSLPAGYSFTTNGSGVEVELGGNRLPQTPSFSLSFGVEYTLPVGPESDIVFRGDYYYQNESFARIYNDAVDRIDAWSTLNMSVQWNVDNGTYYAKLFCTNCANEQGLTGVFVADPSAGLYNNAFVQDPRVIGVTFGANF